jgi:hypothetical protein
MRNQRAADWFVLYVEIMFVACVLLAAVRVSTP